MRLVCQEVYESNKKRLNKVFTCICSFKKLQPKYNRDYYLLWYPSELHLVATYNSQKLCKSKAIRYSMKKNANMISHSSPTVLHLLHSPACHHHHQDNIASVLLIARSCPFIYDKSCVQWYSVHCDLKEYLHKPGLVSDLQARNF